MKKVFIGIPTMSSVHTFLMSRIVKLFTDQKVSLQMYCTINEQPVDNARNKIVDEFLKSDCTHLFFIDSDTIPPEDALYKMLELNKDIVSALTPMIRMSPTTHDYFREWNCVGMDGKHLQPDTGVVPILGAGASCFLIKRKVFDMPKPYFRNTYADDSGRDVFIGEDIYFMTKAHQNGYKAYADTSIICNHNKSTLW